MMRENFSKIVFEGINAGFNRGVTLFMEELNIELDRDEVIKEHSLDKVIDVMVDKYLAENNLILK